MHCEPRKKIDFLMEVFDTISTTQCIIFVNTKDFCETVQRLLRSRGYKSTIMFGKMDALERDEMMSKFRNLEVNVFVTTNMLARGVDVPECELVINFDVPVRGHGKDQEGDPETYLHRIGRSGRFGRKSIAVTLCDKGRP